MKRLPILLMFLGVTSQAQWVVGIGPTYSIPENPDYKAVNHAALGGTLTFFSRQYCNLWYGVRLEYSPLARHDSLPQPRHQWRDMSMFSAELRWFPWEPADIPLYVAGMLGLNNTMSRPDTDLGPQRAGSPTAIGYSVGLGGLLFYNSPCCGWFVDLSLRYHAPNGLVRSTYRPSLSSWQALVMLHMSLGGSQ